MATIQELHALALQIRDADEDRENTALKVGQFLYDLLGYLDAKADLTPKGQWSKQLNFNQTPIVALQSVEAIPDSQGQNNKMWWSSDDGQLKWKANDEVYPLGNPTYVLYYCGNKIYRWSGSSTGFTEMEASGGASSITAFASYVVKNSTSELPSTGNANTGYIVGTHIYAYVGSHGDTADGKYQDLGGVVSVIPTIDPVTKNWIIGGVLTDRPSRGEKGDNAPVPYIDETTGNWVVAGVDTGVHAQGDTGNTQILDPTTFDPVTQIVNNLHQGGEGDALSAEMGKRLGDAVFDGEEEELDFSEITLTNAYIVFDNDESHNPKNKDKWGSNSNYKGKFVPIPARIRGWRYKVIAPLVTLGSSSWYQARWAFLLSNDHTTDAELVLATGESYSRVASGGASERVKEGVIPSDAEYLYIYCYNSGYTPQNFPPEFFVYNPNPTSRIERLEDLTDGVDEIKEGWFAVSGEPYQEEIDDDMVGRQQTIGRDANAGKYYDSSTSICIPKIPETPVDGSVYTPSPSECFNVDNLPNGVLAIKFNQTTPARWVVFVMKYDVNCNFIGHNIKVINSGNAWAAELDLSGSQVKYFKLTVYHETTSGTGDNVANLNLQDGFMEITMQVPSQESMPDRVAALEENVANAAKDTIRILQYNIGHFAMGRDKVTHITDQLADDDASWPHCNYDVQLKRWKSKIQNVAADVMFFEEYSETFGSKNGSNVSTINSGILQGYPYVDVSKNRDLGISPYTDYWVHALVSKYHLLSAYNVVLTPSGLSISTSAAHMRVATIEINGIAVKLAVTHLHPYSGAGYYEIRDAEIKNIIKHFQDDEHVIVCGDFNTDKGSGASAESLGDYHAGAAEYDPFFYGFEEEGVTYEGGYTAANHGLLGDLPTYSASGSRPDRDDKPQVPYCYLDNVLTKGFRMSNVIVIDDGTLTDHCGIMCDLTLL